MKIERLCDMNRSSEVIQASHCGVAEICHIDSDCRAIWNLSTFNNCYTVCPSAALTERLNPYVKSIASVNVIEANICGEINGPRTATPGI